MSETQVTITNVSEFPERKPFEPTKEHGYRIAEHVASGGIVRVDMQGRFNYASFRRAIHDGGKAYGFKVHVRDYEPGVFYVARKDTDE